MDARGVHSSKSLMFAEVRARKPNLPVLAQLTADRPIVRCVPHEEFAASAHLVAEWAPRVAAWIADGKRPYVFLHARRHVRVGQRVCVPRDAARARRRRRPARIAGGRASARAVLSSGRR